eukprot:COSAG06_NODE_3955_length_4723_cov_2.210162_2_plen_98_part_00
MLWPNLNGWGAATMCYSSAAGSSGYDEHWVSNTVVLGPPNVGTSRGDGYTDKKGAIGLYDHSGALSMARTLGGDSNQVPAPANISVKTAETSAIRVS